MTLLSYLLHFYQRHKCHHIKVWSWWENMKKIMKVVLITCMLFAVNVFSVPKMSVVALEENVSIVLEENALSFQSIEPFSEYGIAIITALIDGEYRVGLMNNQGQIIIEPQYYGIYDYNQDWYYAIRFEDGVFGYPDQYMGLISKKDGSIILPVEYANIKLIFGHDLFLATRVETVENTEEGYFYTNEYSKLLMVEDGNIVDAPLPSGIDPSQLRYVHETIITEEVKMLFAEIYYGDTQLAISWFTDQSGVILNNQAYVGLTDYVVIDGHLYFPYHAKFTTFDQKDQGGILKVSTQNALAFEDVLSDQAIDLQDFVIDRAYVEYNRNSIFVLRSNTQEVRYYNLKTNEVSLTRFLEETGPFSIVNDEQGKYTLLVSESEQYSGYDYIGYIEDLSMYILHTYVMHENEGGIYYTYTSRFYHIDQGHLSVEYNDFPFGDLLRKGSVIVSVASNEEGGHLGIIGVNGQYILDPIYNFISSFNAQGFAKVCLEVSHYCGLVDLNYQFIVQPKYELAQFFYDLPWGNMYDVPSFDENGNIKIIKMSEGSWGTQYVGIANKEQVVLEAIYHDAYFEDQYYYTKLDNQFTIYNTLLEPLHTIHPIAEVTYYDRVSYVNQEYFIVSGFDEVYNYSVGVLNIDKQVVIPFEYQEIKYDGEFFYLTKYDQTTDRYLNAVMNKNYEFVVPFETGYDTISEYVGEYAIATKSTEEAMSTLSTTLMENVLNSNLASLDVLNRSGIKVGDFTHQYDSIMLLSEHEEYVLVLVQKEGQYFTGKLMIDTGGGDPEDPIDVFKNMANVGELIQYLKDNGIPVTTEWIKAALMYFRNEEGKPIPPGFYVVKGLVYFDNEVVMTMKEYQFSLKNLKLE